MLNYACGSESLPSKVVVDIANHVMAKLSELSGVKSEGAPRKARKARDLRVTETEFKKLPPTVLGKMSKVSSAAYA